MISATDVEQLRRDLMNAEKDDREAALQRLSGWKPTAIDQAGAHALLEAAALAYPEVPGTYPASPNEDLVRVLWEHPDAADPRFVEHIVPALPADAQLAAIRLLASNPVGAAPLADVLRAIGDGRLPLSPHFYPVLLPLQHSPHADELAGPLIALLSRQEWTHTAGSALLAFARSGELNAAQRAELAAWLADELPGRLSALANYLSEHGPDARFSEESDYATSRAATGLLLDLAGRTTESRTTGVLLEAASHADPWLATWGILGLARLGAEPPRSAVDATAADPECRLAVVEGLAELGQADLIAERWRTQLSIAEANMVRWLSFPTELGRPPTQIEHLQTFRIDDDGHPADLFLFKFRTDPPHWSAGKGWMTGVSGPFWQDGPPAAQSGGMTFSRFEALDSRSPAEHLKTMIGTLTEWAKQQADDAQDEPSQQP